MKFRDISERVKGGKLDPLSKMGKQKLTGQEVARYYKDNPKAKQAAKDPLIKKAIELALDLGGAYSYAVKEIGKLNRNLPRHPEVKKALQTANESVNEISEAHFATYHTPNQKKSMKDFIALAKKMPGVSDVTSEKQKNSRGQPIFRTSYKTDNRTADKLQKQQSALEKKYKEESVETEMTSTSSVAMPEIPLGRKHKVMKRKDLEEVTRQEVDAMKKVSKDMQSVLKSYQKIANMGDKELKNTVHNKSYKQVLDARDTILKMIGTLNTKMLMQKEDFELVEASAGEMIDKLFNLKGNKDAGYGVAKLLSMTGVKVIQAMQKQNPQGFMKTVIALGQEKGKMRIPTNNALMKMFKQQGVKPLPEESEESVEKTTEKLVERNMLGRLAKQLKLNEEGKQKMFAYFEKGELKQW